MKLSNRGRPPRNENCHIVWLTTSTLKLWNNRKRASHFKHKSNSEFAEALLRELMFENSVRQETSETSGPGGGLLPKLLGGGVPHGSQNPDSISDQNI